MAIDKRNPVDKKEFQEMADELGIGGGSTTVAWDDVTGKPTTFAPEIGTTDTTALAGDTPILSAGAIAAIAALTPSSTAADIVAALQTV